MARQLVQCTLPHSNPGDELRAWTRRSGNVSLVIQPGWDGDKERTIGYPYGCLPRLILFWITTEAVAKKERKLFLGKSFSHFMRELGLDPSRGGARSDAVRLREQMRRLFASSISFQQTIDQDGRHGEQAQEQGGDGARVGPHTTELDSRAPRPERATTACIVSPAPGELRAPIV